VSEDGSIEKIRKTVSKAYPVLVLVFGTKWSFIKVNLK